MNGEEFHNWQKDTGWDEPPYERASPALVSLLNYLLETFGGASLGIHGDRPIRSGQSPSSHAFGAALDWRWGAHPNVPMRKSLTREQVNKYVLPFLILNSEELGVQAIHDQGRIWRPTRYPAWRDYNTGYGEWLHIEVSEEKWFDGRPVHEKLKGAVPPPPPPPKWPPFDPQHGVYGLYPLNPDKATVGRYQNASGTIVIRGDLVRYLQGVLLNEAGQKVTVDGFFGEQSETALKTLQKFCGLTPDGYCGKKTWGLIDYIATR